MTTATAELPPTSTASKMTAADRAAESQAPSPASLPNPKPRLPVIQRRLEEAAGIRANAEADAARADALTVDANRLGQQIAALESERTELQARLSNIESRNLATEKLQAESTFDRYFGLPALPHHLTESLNSAIIFLDTIAVVERRSPILVKVLKSRVAEIEKELASLAK
jgi:hypothetical protein